LAIYGLFFCFDSCIVASDSHYPTVAVWDTRASDATVRELRSGDLGEATCLKYQEFGNDQVIYINMRHILYVCMLEIFVDQKRKRGWVSRIYGLDAYFLLTDSKFVYWFIVYPRVLCFPPLHFLCFVWPISASRGRWVRWTDVSVGSSCC
jgi:hypothetical protein